MTAHDTIQAPILKPIPAAPTSSQVVDLPSTFQGQLKTGARGFDLPKNAMADNLNSSPRFKEKKPESEISLHRHLAQQRSS